MLGNTSPIIWAIFIIACYITYNLFISEAKNVITTPLLSGDLVSRPHVPNEMTKLMNVEQTYPMWTDKKISAGKNVATSVMPDQKVINGIAPFNPDLEGKEWSSFADATYFPTKQQTPAPGMIPVPTMLPSPIKIRSLYAEKFINDTENNNYVGNKLVTPIDGVMSQWNQFGPCSNTNVQERTRTCVHDEVGGGKPCGHTLEKRSCLL